MDRFRENRPDDKYFKVTKEDEISADTLPHDHHLVRLFITELYLIDDFKLGADERGHQCPPGR